MNGPSRNGRRLSSLVALAVLVTVPCAAQPAPAERRVVDTVLAKVNGEIITASSFRRTFEPLEQRVSEKFADKPDELMEALELRRRSVLEKMIDNMLLSQLARARGVKVSEDDVREVIDRIMLENNIKSEEEFILALRGEGIDFEEFKSDLRDQGQRERLIQQEILRKLSVGDADIQRYYSEHADRFAVPARSHVLEIGLGDDHAGAEQRLAGVKQRLVAGESFEQVAKEASQAPSAEHGGDLGWFAKGDLDPAIEAAITLLKPGEISALVQSSYGYRIFKLAERQDAGQRPLDDVRKEVEDVIRNQKYDEELDALVVKLRSEAEIRYKDAHGALVEKSALGTNDPS